VTNLAADQKFDRILRSLKENSAEFESRRRAEQGARVRRVLAFCFVFAAGAAVGALSMTLH
jgi:hypothetical protein